MEESLLFPLLKTQRLEMIPCRWLLATVRKLKWRILFHVAKVSPTSHQTSCLTACELLHSSSRYNTTLFDRARCELYKKRIPIRNTSGKASWKWHIPSGWKRDFAAVWHNRNDESILNKLAKAKKDIMSRLCIPIKAAFRMITFLFAKNSLLGDAQV